ncbi:MAG TPA: chemotaxis protein CheW [Longimicrobiales bacterium]|nr:chemotaxis protein CheW [Longimicrobiales bacterium]
MSDRPVPGESSTTRLTGGAAPGWMSVRVAGVTFALPIETVGEVVPTPTVSAVPMVPSWVAGIVSIRGEVVPVVDPGARLFGRPASREGRLVLARPDDAGERIGLLVDAVAGLIDRGSATVAAADDAPDDVPAPFVAAVVSGAGFGRLPVLDLEAMLDREIAGGETASPGA